MNEGLGEGRKKRLEAIFISVQLGQVLLGMERGKAATKTPSTSYFLLPGLITEHDALLFKS